MVERSRRGKGKYKRRPELLGSHARCWIWGRNLVQETLTAARWPVIELHLAADLPAAQLEEARAHTARWGAKVLIEGRDKLERLGRTAEHQGYLAKMGPFPYTPVEEIVSSAPASPLFVVLDAIQDPFNFGAMLRSAGAFGVGGVFIGGQRQVPVTSMVARSSAGVINRVPIARVEDLVELAETLNARRVALIGACEKASLPLSDCDFRKSTAIVIGNEGTGIRPELIGRCDELVRIPIAEGVGSLNAAAAAAVFLYEVQRQRSAPDAGYRRE